LDSQSQIAFFVDITVIFEQARDSVVESLKIERGTQCCVVKEEADSRVCFEESVCKALSCVFAYKGLELGSTLNPGWEPYVICCVLIVWRMCGFVVIGVSFEAGIGVGLSDLRREGH
jgi:hypothetical protein